MVVEVMEGMGKWIRSVQNMLWRRDGVRQGEEEVWLVDVWGH